MKKHIQALVKFLGNNRAELTIIGMSHKHYEFSARGKSNLNHHTGVFKHKDVLLISASWIKTPEYAYKEDMTDKEYKNFHFLCLGEPGRTLTIPAQAWPTIKEALEAYNTWGASL